MEGERLGLKIQGPRVECGPCAEFEQPVWRALAKSIA